MATNSVTERMFHLKSMKLVLVGDGISGKTCLLGVFKDSVFPNQFTPTVFEKYVHEYRLGDETIELELIDTGGIEDLDGLRPLCYPNTHVILICFSIGDPFTYDNVALKWIKEVSHFCPDVPIILVGTKKDLRNDPNTIGRLAQCNMSPPKSYVDGVKLAKTINAKMYLECSALKQEGVQEIFYNATQIAVDPERNIVKTRQTCNIF